MRIVTLAALVAGLSLLTGGNTSAQEGSWTPIYDAPASGVRAIEMFDDAVGLASTATTLLRTTNGGATWSQVIDDLDQGFSAFGFVDARQVWAVGEQTTIARSNDGGRTWTPQLVDPVGDLQSIATVSATEAWTAGSDVDYNDIMSCCYFGSRLLHTTDGGRTWLPVAPLDGYRIFHSVTFVGDAGWIVASPCAPKQDIRDCGTERHALLRTDDGGATWSVAAESPAEFAPTSIAFVDQRIGYGTANCVTFDPCERKVWRTDDGGDTWAELAFSPVDARRLRIAPNGDVWTDGYQCATEGCGRVLGRSGDGGQTWTQLPTGEAQRLEWDITSTHAVVGRFSGDLQRYDLADDVWTASTTPIGPAFEYVSFAPDSDDMGYATGHRAYHATRDGGRTWRPLESPAKPGRLFAGPVPTVWFAGGEACAGCPNIHRSNDGGQTWTGFIGPWILLDSVHAVDDRRAYVVADTRLWRTDDGGATWTLLRDDGDPARRYRFVGRDFAYSLPDCRGPDCDDSFVLTLDGGATWQSRAIPPFEYFSPTFVTPATAFAMRGCEPRRQCPQTHSLMRTTDGGVTWRDIAVLPVPLRDFTFLDGQRGWATGDAGEDHRNYVYATVDGGVTWNVEFTLPAPASPAGLALHGDRLTLHAKRGYVFGQEDHTYFFERPVAGGVQPITGPVTGSGAGNDRSAATWTLAALVGLATLAAAAWGIVRHRRQQS